MSKFQVDDLVVRRGRDGNYIFQVVSVKDNERFVITRVDTTPWTRNGARAYCRDGILFNEIMADYEMFDEASRTLEYSFNRAMNDG